VHHLEHSAVVLADLMFRGPQEAEWVQKILLDFGSEFSKVEKWKRECLNKTETIINLRLHNSCLEEDLCQLSNKLKKMEKAVERKNVETQTENVMNSTSSESKVMILPSSTDNSDGNEEVQILKSPTTLNKKPPSVNKDSPSVNSSKKASHRICILKFKSARRRVSKLEKEVHSLLEEKIKLLQAVSSYEKKKIEMTEITAKFSSVISRFKKSQTGTTVRLLDVVKARIEDSKSVMSQNNSSESESYLLAPHPTTFQQEKMVEYSEGQVHVKQEPLEQDYTIIDLSTAFIKQEPQEEFDLNPLL